MSLLLNILHILVCFFLILVVLLQTGKGGDLASTFGGGSSQTVFGARGGATLLSKLTIIAAIVFILTSLVLAILSTGESGTVMEDVEEGGKAKAPAQTQPKAPGEAPPKGAESEAPSTEGETGPSGKQGQSNSPSGETGSQTGENPEPKSDTSPPD